MNDTKKLQKNIEPKQASKAFLKSFTLFSLLFSLFSSASAFSDIASDDPYRHVYEHLRDVSIMPAHGEGFRPYDSLTRAEALLIAMRAGYIPVTEFDGDAGYADVDPNEWYAPVINAALDQKIIINRNKNFRPTQPVTKAEFLAFLFRATGVDFNPYFGRTRGIALDVPTEAWFAPHFAYAKKFQIAHLPADNFYLPNKTLNRKEVAIMTFRQLRIFHGDEVTKSFVELQAQIQRFLSLVRDGKHSEAEFQLHRILELSDNIVRTKNGSDALAARAISNSMEHLVTSLRHMRYKSTLGSLENLMLALKQAERASELSESLKPFANELSGVVREMLLQVMDQSYMAAR